MLLSTLIFLFFLFLTYAIFLLTTRKADLRQMRLQKRVAEALQDLGSQDPELQLSREDSIGGYRVVNQVLSSIDVIKKLDQIIRQAGLQITVSRLLVFCVIAGVLALFATLTMMPPVMAIVPALFAASLPLLYVSFQRKKRLHKINSQLPDTLEIGRAHV